MDVFAPSAYERGEGMSRPEKIHRPGTGRPRAPALFSPGDRVVVEGYAAKNPARRMALGVFAD
jgi:hypothetical protein